MLFLLVPAWAALALVYYLYQREFFYSAFYTGLGTMLPVDAAPPRTAQWTPPPPG